MKLIYTPLQGLVHKVQVVATEAGIYDDLEKSPTIPYHQTPGRREPFEQGADAGS